MARDAALRRPHTNMVTERSALPARGEQPSILARLREWSAQHPLRPPDGSPPELCPPDEIPIHWAQSPTPDEPYRLPALTVRRAADVEVRAAEAVVAALEQAAVAEDDASLERAREQLYAAALNATSATVALVLPRLVAVGLKPVTVWPQARWLLEQAAHGEALELAMGLCFASREPSTHADLAVLARHPQLWHIATRLLDARGVDTLDLRWARIHHAGCCSRRDLLREVAPRLQDRVDIRRWVLLEGMRSWPGDPFLQGSDQRADSPFVPCVAAACAVAGDLAGALDDSELDADLFDAACRMAEDMFGEMHEPDFETCPDGVLIMDRLVGHLLDRCQTLAQLWLVQRIQMWLEWPPADEMDEESRSEQAAVWERRESLGWTEEVRADLTDDCARILRRPHWPARIREAFAAYEPYDRSDPTRGVEGHVAWPVSQSLGIDLWEVGLGHFARFPQDHVLAARLLETADRERAARVIQLAEQLLPARLLAESAQADPPPHFRITSLTFIFQGMRRHSIFSAPLVEAALRLAGNERFSATRVLEQQPTETWGSEIIATLRSLATDSDDRRLRDIVQALLAQLDASTAS